MITLIQLFFTDPVLFAKVMRDSINWLRGVAMTLALGLASGVGPFADLTKDLGKAGWIGAGILIVATSMSKSGDKTPPQLKGLSSDELDALVKLAQEKVAKGI